jgi:hypothetical protein
VQKKKDVEQELGIDIEEQKETDSSADLFKELRLRKEQIPLKPLLKGKFPSKEEIPVAQEVKQLSKEEYPGGKAGKKGGKVAASKSSSAAALTKILAGIRFPKNKSELLDWTRRLKSKIKAAAAEQIITIIQEMPDRKYHNMADVEKALAEIR